MNNEILFKILQLDSLFGFLDWTERAYIHHLILGKSKITTPVILEAYLWIEKTHWPAPEMRFMDDRLLYFKSQYPGKWHPAEDYKTIYPAVEKAMKQLKI